MKIKPFMMAVLISGIFAVSCQDKKETTGTTNVETTENTAPIENTTTVENDTIVFLVGSWKDQSKAALDFTLFKDGKAQSDNMKTLLYSQWMLNNNQLSLVAESIGNKQSSIDTVVYTIDKINNNELILKKDQLILTYKKGTVQE